MVGGGSLENVVHEGREDLGYSEYTGAVRAVLGRAGDFLVLLLGQVYPLPDYGVDKIQNAQFMSSRRLLQLGVEFLDKERFVLEPELASANTGVIHRRRKRQRHTLMLFWQSSVRLLIREVETPGGFR